MNIKEEELFNYINCPTFYDLAYNKHIPLKDNLSMQTLLDTVTHYFYSNLINGKVCTMDELKNKWDSICDKNKYYIDSKKNLEGINYIINFARFIVDYKPNIIDFEKYYEVDIDGIILNGNISVINMLPNRKIELLIHRFSNKAPNQIELDKKLKYTIDSYVLKKLYNCEVAAIKVIHHKNNSEYITTRNNNDYDRLEISIKNIAKCIKDNLYYPRENVFCNTCYYKEYCKYWC